MSTSYETDVVAWSEEQAALLRRRDFASLDIEHIAEEIEDVGKSEQRELASRMSLLIAHLLKWQFQPERRCNSWRRTIREQRRAIDARISDTPSLKASLANRNWLLGVWADAVTKAIAETGLADFPEDCPWPVEELLAPEFYPEAAGRS
jgi:hypothetical protein